MGGKEGFSETTIKDSWTKPMGRGVEAGEGGRDVWGRGERQEGNADNCT